MMLMEGKKLNKMIYKIILQGGLKIIT